MKQLIIIAAFALAGVAGVAGCKGSQVNVDYPCAAACTSQAVACMTGCVEVEPEGSAAEDVQD